MEKILRHSIIRRNVLAVKSRKVDQKELRKQWRETKQFRASQASALGSLIREERKARQEDWQLGPLAPNRESGTSKGRYGALSPVLAMQNALPDPLHMGPKGRGEDAHGSEDKSLYPRAEWEGYEVPAGEWRGKGTAGNLIPGDRAVVIRGRENIKGLIGEVANVDLKARMVTLRDINKADVVVPPHALSTREKIVPQDRPIPINDVRLVYAREDPETGVTRDVIVRHLFGGPPYEQRQPGSNLPRHTRYVMGINEEIPWPEEEADRQYAHEVDTPIPAVDEVTYIPSLYSHFPQPSIIDELRAKYSKDKRKHDDLDWIRKKVLEDARQDWLKSRTYLMASNIRPSTYKHDPHSYEQQLKSTRMQRTMELVRKVRDIKQQSTDTTAENL